jgi:hypothetical protein
VRLQSILIATLAIGLTGAAAPESRLESYFRLRQEAAAAFRDQDLIKAETLLEDALALYPESPGSLIRLARVEMAAGKPAEALAHLTAYADLGLTLDVARDSLLAPLAEAPDFAPVKARLEANAAPTGAVTTIATLDRPGAIFEGLAWDGASWLVSSVTDHTILRVRDGKPEPFLKADGIGGLFGMAVDLSAGVVWAAEANGPDIPGSTGPARTAVLKISLADGSLIARYPLAEDGKPRQLGDVTLGPDGTLYASDTIGAGLYRLKPGAAALELLLQSSEMGSPQGMVACGRDSLIVADYTTGLHRIDLAAGTEAPIGGARAALAGTDGLFRVAFDFQMANRSPLPLALMATQNGVAPARVLLLRISPDCQNLEDWTTIASGHDALDDMTLGAEGPSGPVVIGGGGWSGYGPDGKRREGAAPGPARLLGLGPPRGF